MLTPDGNKYDPSDPSVIGDAWISDTDFPNLATYKADSTKSTYLDQFILDACAAVNSMCGRKFNKQQQDQMIPNIGLSFESYRTFVLDNRPLVTVDNVWLQVVNSFSAINKEYFQVFTAEGMVKIMPDFTVTTRITVPMARTTNASNLWIRYTAGYDPDDVPRPVKQATAMYVSYLYSSFDIDSGVLEFKTQTYSQRNITDSNKDPVLVRINNLLEPYKMNKVVA